MNVHPIGDRTTLFRQIARCVERGWWSPRLSFELDRAVVHAERHAHRPPWDRARRVH